jgi:hypothetical protein
MIETINSPTRSPLTLTPIAERPRGARAVELIAVGLALCLVIALQFLLTDSWWLFTRHFWLDEIYTNTLVTDPSAGHAFRALGSGVETHPPALYLLLRGYGALVHASDEIVLRSFALLAVVLGLVGIYGCLRYCFAAWASFAAVLALWCHPLVLDQAFNARFYGPWMAAAAWCAYLLVRQRSGRFQWIAGLALAMCAALVCTIHYFGIISLALIAAAEVGARRRARLPLAGLSWMVAGPLALAACLPLLRGQGHALTETTWMAPVTWKGAVGLFRAFVLDLPFGWLALAAWLSIALRKAARRDDYGSLDPLWGLTALVGLPVVMVVFSYLVQPAYDSRYCFPAVAGLAGAAAWICSYCSRGWTFGLCGWLVLVGAVTLDQTGQRAKALWVTVPDRLIAELRKDTDEAPIVFELPWQLYVVYRYAPDLRSRCVLLDYETGEIGNRLQGEIFARDLARRFSEFYAEPPAKRWADISRWRGFYLVPSDYGLAAKPPPVDAFYPGFHVTPVAPGVYRLTAANSEG